jgi:2,4-didehydro-3-deoxy-L-rhamnonate hydrolase
MRLGNLSGRLVLLGDDQAVDVEQASAGRFGPDPQAVYGQWAEFTAWAADEEAGATQAGAVGTTYSPADLLAPVPRPAQVFAVGLNYHDHAAESKIEVPQAPLVFTKFPTCLTGPQGEITLPKGSVDWEAEIVAVVGRGGRDIPPGQAWPALAGLMLGQDISERQLQGSGKPPQFSMGKSFEKFGPTGPFVATLDEFGPDIDIEFGCRVDGETVQHSRTSAMVFDIPAIVASLSEVTELLPGDLIFTGTPSGVGMARTPPRFLASGSELVTYAAGLGEMRHTFV